MADLFASHAARHRGVVSQSQHAAALGDQHDARSFGAHVRSLRRVRGLTQEQLAERSDLASDTIRRLEHGAFSPSLDTITKLCRGLGLHRSTLFEAFELGERAPLRELTNLACTRSDADIEMAIVMLGTLFDQLDRQRAAALLKLVTPAGASVSPAPNADTVTQAPEPEPEQAPEE